MGFNMYFRMNQSIKTRGLVNFRGYLFEDSLIVPEFKSKVQFLKDNLKKEFLRVVSFGFEEVRC